MKRKPCKTYYKRFPFVQSKFHIMKQLLIWSIATLVLIGSYSCTKDAKSVLEKAEMATFIIYTFDEHGSPAGSGSGFFIDKDGTGITNYHVLDKSMKAVIRLKDGEEYEINKVLASDKKWDIVKFSIFKEDNENFHFLKFSKDKVEQGDKVYNLSAPMGLDQTFADGLVSSIRTDSHGQVVQITIPISQGSSGSPILNENGDVVAVATFKQSRGENLNFAVEINDESLSLMTSNPFSKSNRQFNDKEDFVILNIPSDLDNELVLNALQFKDDATIAYLSYTNLDMSNNGRLIWCKTNDEDAFYIKDRNSGFKSYIVSSTIGNDRENGTVVPLATVHKFQIFFPAVKKGISHIDIAYGNNPRWSFSDIILDKYRNSIQIDLEKYHIEYAYSTMREGELETASSIFDDILENDPENIYALNAMGIISYVIDNNQDAIRFFTEVIDCHPNSIIGYLNRSCVYKYQGDMDKATADITKAINITPEKPELYVQRAELYTKQKEWVKAKHDLDKILAFSDYKEDGMTYYLRGICNAQLDNIKDATNDLYQAYNLSSDTEMRQMIAETLGKILPQKNYRANYSTNQSTESLYLKGNIGTLHIVMHLVFHAEGRIRGWYYYESQGPKRKLSLSGEYGNNGSIVLNEFDESGNQTGKYRGRISEGVFYGSFLAYHNSRTYDFRLYEL